MPDASAQNVIGLCTCLVLLAETALYNKSNVRIHDTTEDNISSIIFYFNHSNLTAYYIYMKCV
jgi:hypothetical protein